MATAFDPFEYLDLPPYATEAEVLTACRRLARVCHPDHGGTDETFDKLQKAKIAAIAACRKSMSPKPCAACRGSGQVVHASGWGSITTACKDCGGGGTSMGKLRS